MFKIDKNQNIVDIKYCIFIMNEAIVKGPKFWKR